MVTATQTATRPTVVIFLDIDGVLCRHDQDEKIALKARELFKLSAETKPTFHQLRAAATHFFDPEALNNLYNLIARTQMVAEVKIVISSSWRIDETVSSLRQLLSNHSFSNLIIDKTNDYSKMDQNSHARAALIQEWLNEHPDVINFVIIDDYNDNGILSLLFKDHFVFVNESLLLTRMEIDVASNLINQQMSKIKAQAASGNAS